MDEHGGMPLTVESELDESIDWRSIQRRLVVYFRASFSMNVVDSQDAAQTVIERLLEAESRREPSKPFLPWCYRIARNYGIDRHRARSRAPETYSLVEDRDQFASRYVGPEEELERAETEFAVKEFIDGLSDGDREIAFLRFYEEMKCGQIARLVRKPGGTVRYRIHVIRRRLREYLEECC